ncbi:helix-turn-helix domain-containing protein [Arthrobacter sp. FX8]|uniref:helix-turn-helix domain-containing protein n=1 Tax=Arthrobacter sp. FX8 TaxID=2997335 RepID=UPI00227B7CE5|nr:helix-turn-helix domain-containing protein [Arthrobacter sp. FX8]WAJ32218.1 helix-turn-helix domain-containing protein [Arthrobacter sp. FX8]
MDAPQALQPNFDLIQAGAEKYKTSTRTIRRLIEAGKLTEYRVGRVVRIDMTELDRLFAHGGDSE